MGNVSENPIGPLIYGSTLISETLTPRAVCYAENDLFVSSSHSIKPPFWRQLKCSSVCHSNFSVSQALYRPDNYSFCFCHHACVIIRLLKRRITAAIILSGRLQPASHLTERAGTYMTQGAFMLNFWGQNQRFQTWLEQNAVASMLIFE